MKTLSSTRRYTIGYLSSWHVFEGAAVEPYSHSLMKGLRAAANALGCRLLLACGKGPLASERVGAPAWPHPEDGPYFVPVGPWNTDGLVVLPTELTPEQSRYLQDLRLRGYPVVFAGPGEDGPTVTIDNNGGIRQAVEHLAGHGHRQIALVRGVNRDRGDSIERQQAYEAALHTLGLPVDPRLQAYGEHSYAGGQRAMREILASGVPFTAVIASNDRSAMGAISALKEAGRRVPEDTAVIGFDDLSEAKAWVPALTTLRNVPFELGYQSVARLVDILEGQDTGTQITLLSAPLIVRRSCGCDGFAGARLEPGECASRSARMTEAVTAEIERLPRQQIEDLCGALDTGFQEMTAAADQPQVAPDHSQVAPDHSQVAPDRSQEAEQSPAREDFWQVLETALRRTEELDEDPFAWNGAINVLRTRVDLDRWSAADRLAHALLDEAQLEIGERSRRQFVRRQFQQSEAADRLSMMIAQLLAALSEAEVREVLEQQLGLVGVRRMLAIFLVPDDLDPSARSRVFLSYGFPKDRTGEEFATRRFPLPGWDTPDEPACLALLPLVITGRARGYVAFETNVLEPLAVIVRNLETALRSSYLFADAIKGRRMAEEADQIKSRFLSMVSHELRTPLNLIVGLSEILLRQRDQIALNLPGVGSLWQDLERIYANSQHLGRLINDVLDLVSSETGHLRLQREPLDLAEVLRPVAVTGEQMAREKGLVWNASLPAHGPLVLGDRTRLRQVTLNLISNAVKFTFQGEVALDVREYDGQVTVSIRDTGMGVPLAEQENIFNEFARSEAVVQRGIGGMGLGLAITRELVERQGGKIGLVSSGEESSGSTFFFSLPVIAPLTDSSEQLDQGERRTAVFDPGGRRVALLTHQTENGQRLADHLRERGFLLNLFDLEQDPQWMLHLLACPPGALILEESLAAQRGWEILTALKRHAETAHLPVLVCALEPGSGKGAMLELDYQLKPLTAEQLGRALETRGISGAFSSILVVDDHAAIRDYHTRLIQERLPGCQVIQAENGREALALMRHTLPDLVLLDLMMPEVDGFGVLEGMRECKSTHDIPVIVLTGKSLTEEDTDRLNRGVAAVLSKGIFSAPEIVDHIEGVLARNRSLGTSAQRLVRRAIAFIQTHYAEPLSRDQIAEYLCISPDHLSDCFHQEMGITPITYLNRYRINQARGLLEARQRSITEVALAVGFSDGAHFSRVFQREVGVSPREYVKGKQSLS